MWTWPTKIPALEIVGTKGAESYKVRCDRVELEREEGEKVLAAPERLDCTRDVRWIELCDALPQAGSLTRLNSTGSPQNQHDSERFFRNARARSLPGVARATSRLESEFADSIQALRSAT